jgi:hypothetical protein
MKVWRVVYDCVFSSSSGMESYTIKHPLQQGMVCTVGDSLKDVEDTIQQGMDNQTRLTRLVSAEWLGDADIQKEKSSRLIFDEIEDKETNG